MILVATLPITADARPVSYTDGWMVMTMNDFSTNSTMLLYSPTAKFSLGPAIEHWRDEDAEYAGLAMNGLLKRWNNPDSQGNWFILSGAGIARDNNISEGAVHLGTEIDWEDRRYYVSYENHGVLAGDIKKEFSEKARVGIAPYVAEFGELHTWLMLQVDHMPEDEDHFRATPLIRMFKDNWLGELGVSNKGEIMFNLTLTY